MQSRSKGYYYAILEAENILLVMDAETLELRGGFLYAYMFKREEIELFEDFNLERGCKYIEYYPERKVAALGSLENMHTNVFVLEPGRGYAVGYKDGELLLFHCNYTKRFDFPTGRVRIKTYRDSEFVCIIGKKKECFCYIKSGNQKNKAWVVELDLTLAEREELLELAHPYEEFIFSDLYDETIRNPHAYKYTQLTLDVMPVLLPYLTHVDVHKYGEVKKLR
jgi:hypothetical protein